MTQTTTVEEELDRLENRVPRADLAQLRILAAKLQRDLDAAVREAHEAGVSNEGLREQVDHYRHEKGTPLHVLVDLFETAHYQAHGPEPWDLCPDPICRHLEDWVHHRRRRR